MPFMGAVVVFLCISIICEFICLLGGDWIYTKQNHTTNAPFSKFVKLPSITFGLTECTQHWFGKSLVSTYQDIENSFGNNSPNIDIGHAKLAGELSIVCITLSIAFILRAIWVLSVRHAIDFDPFYSIQQSRKQAYYVVLTATCLSWIPFVIWFAGYIKAIRQLDAG
jgi:hypothetical protein